MAHPLNSGGVPPGDYELWYPRLRGSADLECLARVINSAGFRAVRFIPNWLWHQVSLALGLAEPTSGILAVAMALLLEPEQLSLYGFDGTWPGKAGWGDARTPGGWKTGTSLHDVPREKRLLQALALQVTQEWLGRPANCRVKWVNPPAAELLSPDILIPLGAG
jgi:hypothetical protein